MESDSDFPCYGKKMNNGFHELDDQNIWKIFKRGNKGALAYIYQTYFFKLYNYGFNICGEEELVKDSIQELFIYIWEKRNSLGETNSIKNYLFKSLRRKLFAEFKKDQNAMLKRGIPENYYFEFVFSKEHTMIDRQITIEQKEELVKALNQLPQRLKEVLFLRYYEQLSPTEIASVMDITTNSTYVFLSRAIDFLKKHVHKVYTLMLASSLC
ncbi:RNA polymerase sigma factor [Catalinimonas niigatensis]|uniref:RNA polymerase sigma factor n=1 Tax=Catalinimonas niigatensis TaxID=1397264 RepID=UPI002665F67C|nr:sigma-70 family RNA polymerase sigma factor [Catalinimonas niigatensis]WPP51909.1 sigma-70 family RNA polymerase sigma factor [Catalinimonas niigatensis]